MRQVLERALSDAETLLRDFRNDSEAMEALNRISDQVLNTFQHGGKVMACGNGGSMADAMHFAEEWTGRFRRDREPYPALALADPTHLSCVGNDYGFDHIFSRQVRAFGKPEDTLLLLSTSGNSANLIEAAQAGRERNLTVVGFLGRGGGQVRSLCDLVLMAPGETSDRIQEIHMLCLHTVIEAVEGALGA